jgi:hypothetical protein
VGGRQAAARMWRVLVTGLTAARNAEKSYDHLESMRLCLERQGQRTETVSGDQRAGFLP